MSYRFLEDVAIADLAYEVEAKSLPDLFAEAAEALMKVQIDNLGSIRRDQFKLIELSDRDLEALLHQFLQELVFWKDSQQLLLLPESVKMRKDAGGYHLKASLAGENLDPARHSQGVDVKAVTWHRFRVTSTDKGWQATVVLDI